MGTIGLRLRSQRESRGLGRAEVARATKLWAHHLAALEHEDFDALPQDAPIQRYVRTYAEYLGLDADAFVAEIEQRIETARPGPEPVAEPVAAEPEVEAQPVVETAPEPTAEPELLPGPAANWDRALSAK